MGRFIIIVLFLALSGCAGLGGNGSDNIYEFKSHPIEVWRPKSCISDMRTYNTHKSVDFVTGKGYWKNTGLYSVQVYHIPESVTDKEEYLKSAKDFMATYVAIDRTYFGLVFTIQVEEEVLINNKPGYQINAADKMDTAVMTVTSILHDSRITVVSIMHPPLGKPGWDERFSERAQRCYEKLVNSIKEIKPLESSDKETGKD